MTPPGPASAHSVDPIGTKRTARTRQRIAAIGVVAVIAASFASAADARLVYERGFRTSHPSTWVARDDGRAAHRLASGSSPKISPDGRLVAYLTTGPLGTQRLMLVAATGGGSRLLLRDFLLDIGWSPDGKRIAAVEQTPTTRTNPGARTIVTIDVATSRVHPIAPASVPLATSFSPTGSQLAYTRVMSTNPSRDDIYRQPATGGRAVRLTHDGHSAWPVWGRNWIAFVRQSAPSPRDHIPKQNIYLVKPTGAGLHRLTHVTIGERMFGFTPTAWSANGRRLIAEFNGIGTDYVVTVDPRTGAVPRVGEPSGGTAGHGVTGAALSRDGTTILGVQGHTTPSVVTLPYDGGRPRVLARDAIGASWNR